MSRLFLVCFTFVVQVALASEPPLKEPRPVITFVCDAHPDQPTYQVALTYLTEVFDQLGYDYVQKHADLDDAIAQLRRGEVDGDCARLDGFIEHSGLEHYAPIGPAYTQVFFSRWYLNPQDKPRGELRVGYNANALMLKSHLTEMGYRNLTPSVSPTESIEGLRSGEFDLIVHYERAMDFLNSSDDYGDVKNTDSFVTLPVRPYMTKSMVAKLGQRWAIAANKALERRGAESLELTLPERRKGEIIFSCSIHTESTIYKGIEHRYTQMFDQLGYSFQQISMPRSREAHELSLGNIDGICGRAKLHETKQPNSVRVKVPILHTNIRVWSLSASDEIRSSDDLIPARKIAYVRGSTFLEQALSGYQGHLVPTYDMLIGIKMLAAGRVDYLVGFDNMYQNLIKDTVLKAPIYGVGVLDSVAIYPYFHSSRSDLAEKVELLLLNKLNTQN